MFPPETRVVRRATPETKPPLVLLREAIHEVVTRRRLIRYLVQAAMKKRGSDTVLGNLWWILDPLLQMVVYVIFITIVSRRSTPDYPLFIFAAILPWKWFTTVISDGTSSVVAQDKLIRQIAFPKIVLPLASTTAAAVGFAFGFVPLIGVMLLYPARLTPMILWLPVIAAVQYVFSVGAGILVAAANVFFRDLGNVTRHALRLWWYLSPGLYSLTQFEQAGFVRDHPWIGTVAEINPFAALFEAYRSVIYGTPDGGLPTAPNLVPLAYLLLASVALIVVATIFFKRAEPDFAKVL